MVGVEDVVEGVVEGEGDGGGGGGEKVAVCSSAAVRSARSGLCSAHVAEWCGQRHVQCTWEVQSPAGQRGQRGRAGAGAAGAIMPGRENALRKDTLYVVLMLTKGQSMTEFR